MSKKSQAEEIIQVTKNMGDNCAKKFKKSEDLGVAKVGLDAYKTAVRTAKAEIMYKRQTGSPKKIKFFEKGKS